MHCNHAGDRHTLFLSAGKFVWRIFAIFPHADTFETLFNSLPNLLGRYSHVFRSESDIFFDHRTDDLVVRILKYHPGRFTYLPDILFIPHIHTVHIQGTVCRCQNRIDLLGKRGLSGTIMPQNCHKIAFFHIQIHTVHGTDRLFDFPIFVILFIFKCQLRRLNDSHGPPYFPVFLRYFYASFRSAFLHSHFIVKDLDVNYKSLPAVFLNIFRLLPKNYQFCGYRQNLCRKFSAPPEDPLPPQ